MSVQHKSLTAGRWAELSFAEQMANIGSEVERTIKWKNKGNKEISNRAFERSLELLEMTIADSKNKKHLKELVRLWEFLADYFKFKNEFCSTDKVWQKYFYSFNYQARVSV